MTINKIERTTYNFVERAVKTFVQGFLSSLAALLGLSNISDLKSVLMSALVGGGAAVLSLVSTYFTSDPK